MTQIKDKETEFSSFDEEMIGEYKPMSRLAVLSLALGVASGLALVHPLLWVLPIISVILAMLALQTIANSKLDVTGRNLAVAGAVLSLFFLSFAASKHFSTRAQFISQARQYCDQWLAMVLDQNDPERVKLYQAYELHRPFPKRQPRNTNLVAFYGKLEHVPQKPAKLRRVGLRVDERDAFKNFWASSPNLEMVVFGRAGQGAIRYAGCDSVQHLFKPDIGIMENNVLLRYIFDYVDAGQRKSLTFQVQMQRRYGTTGKEGLKNQHWNVQNMFVLDP